MFVKVTALEGLHVTGKYRDRSMQTHAPALGILTRRARVRLIWTQVFFFENSRGEIEVLPGKFSK